MYLLSISGSIGHSITGEGIAYINNGKLEAMSRPNNVKELQRFLGVANFFRKFIPVFSRVAYPLYQLLRKDKELNIRTRRKDHITV